MKLVKVKEKLEKKLNIKKTPNNKKLSQLKIIGITGSHGKSTTAFIVHEYLKKLGFKSVLYSSLMIDSPISNILKDYAFDIALKDEKTLLSVIKECNEYEAEYLVLEINESILEKGFLKDIPFTIRALTNLNPKHNIERYSEEDYVELKKSFFKNIKEECLCVLGFENYEKKLLEEFLNLNNFPKLITTTNYVSRVKGLENSKVDIMLTDLISTIDKMRLEVKLNNQLYLFDTNLIMSYNVFNILVSLGILEGLKVLDIEQFQKTIKNIKVPGRTEVYKAKGRTIVIDAQLPSALNCLYNFKKQKQISCIKVVIGSVGYGYINWQDYFKSEEYRLKLTNGRKALARYLINYADFVYFTESDSGKESSLDICNELSDYVKDYLPNRIVLDRKEAIETAIKNAKKNEVILISGRGNKNLLCNSEKKAKYLKDSEVVENLLKELKWM